jgi:membrane-associated protein
MTSALGPSWLDAQHLIDTYGLLGILGVVFAECGLLVGFFLPGDSLLFTAGLLVRDGRFHQPLWLVCLLICVAAVLGNQVGYLIGRKAGPAVFSRPDSRLFKQEYVEKTAAFFERHGPRAIVLARFVPIVRTFITVMAGAGRMDVRVYTIYSVIGGVLWGVGVTVLGWALGGVGFIRDNVELILLAVVALSLMPIGVELLRNHRQPRQNSPD